MKLRPERIWRSEVKAKNALFVFLPFLMVSGKQISGRSCPESQSIISMPEKLLRNIGSVQSV